jgi:hypothetical protein
MRDASEAATDHHDVLLMILTLTAPRHPNLRVFRMKIKIRRNQNRSCLNFQNFFLFLSVVYTSIIRNTADSHWFHKNGH